MSGQHCVGRCRAVACGAYGTLRARGYCARCYTYWARWGEERPAGVRRGPRRPLPPSCAVPTCARPIYRDGYCTGCHRRWRHAGRPTAGPPPPLLRHYDAAHPWRCDGCGTARGVQADGRHPRHPGRYCAACQGRRWRARQQSGAAPSRVRPVARGHRSRLGPPGVPAALAVGWVHLAGQGWAPPAGYCTPGETYDQVAGCAGCAWRADCQALTLGRAG